MVYCDAIGALRRRTRYAACAAVALACAAVSGAAGASGALGSASCTNIEGGQTFAPTSTVTIRINGTVNLCTPVDRTSTEYTAITVEGELTLEGGKLQLVLGPAFVPAAGDSFDVFDFGSLSGVFGGFELSAASLPAPLYWNFDALYADGIISVAERAPADPVPALVDAVDQAGLIGHVAALAATGRFSQAQLDAAEAYIRNALTGLGWAVQPPDPIVSFLDARQSSNVVAELPGTTLPDEIILIGAHYDSVAVNVPGADDNASGVAGLLEIARVLAGQSFKRTIRLVAFTFEETFEGSFDYAPKIAAAGDNVIAMLNLESIGYSCPNCQTPFFDVPGCLWVNPDGVTVGTGIATTLNYASTPLLNAVQRANLSYVPELGIFSGTVAGDGSCFPDTRRSDHAAFWDQGYPALMFTDTANFRSPHYHLPSDTIATLDFDLVQKVTRAALATAVLLAEQVRYLGVATPDFVDLAFGVDGEWDTADDYTFAGINPLGLASSFRTVEPHASVPPGGAIVGYAEDFSFAVQQSAGLGSNALIGARALSRITFFLDEAGKTLIDPSLLYFDGGDLELDPIEISTLDIAPDNTFSSNRLFRFIGAEVSGPISAHLGGWYLVNGQAPADAFAGEPAVAAYFDAIIPDLPADWEIVFTERYLGEEANLPGSFLLINATFYSNDPTAVPEGVIGDPDAQQVPVHGLALLALGLALAAAGRVRRRPE